MGQLGVVHVTLIGLPLIGVAVTVNGPETPALGYMMDAIVIGLVGRVYKAGTLQNGSGRLSCSAFNIRPSAAQAPFTSPDMQQQTKCSWTHPTAGVSMMLGADAGVSFPLESVAVAVTL